MPERMIRCPEGHFYDPIKHGSCPWCALPADAGANEKTRPVGGAAISAAGPPPLPPGFGPPPAPAPPPQNFAAPPPPQPFAPPPPAPAPQPPAPQAAAPAPPKPEPPKPESPKPESPRLEATKRLGSLPTAGKDNPVVGWLVCLEGPDKGRDFRLHAEKNFIGRSREMDVCIAGDDSVSREKHGVVIFDPRKQDFWLLPGESSGLVYLNGQVIHAPSQLQRDDVLELGRSRLVLIPFCGEKYHWGATPAGAAPASV